MGRDNLFRSTDAGKTWQPVPGQPTQYRPTHMVMASDGTLYLSYGTAPGPSSMTDGGVWKLDTKSGAWTEITPVKPDAQNASVRLGRGGRGRAQSQGGDRQHVRPHERRRR